jgi:hypothetical protein
MGDLKLIRDKRFKQGFYNPIHPEKYLGKGPIVYRSGLELKFMLWCDRTDTILKWSSESVKIPYYDSVKKKKRTYYVDNYVEILEGNQIKKYLIEIKPHSQTVQPKQSKRKKRSTVLYEQLQWANNNDKWPSAREFAKKRGMEFIIITEKELNQ